MNEPDRLPRILSIKHAYFLIVGNIIGIGIFTTTGYISEAVKFPGYLLLFWLIGGIISFFGALTYAELATRFPKSGGDYHYLSNAYHPLIGFLFGWSALVVTYTGSIATIATGFAHYFSNFLPEIFFKFEWNIPFLSLKINQIKLTAIIITWIFTYVNVRGIAQGARWQNYLTFMGILILFFFVFLGISSKEGNWENFSPFLPENFSILGFLGSGIALIGIYFTYSGWTVIVYIAGEVRDPEKSIPRAMWSGIVTIGILYILVNLIYIYALPVPRMVNVVDIAHKSLLILRGEGWSLFFTVMILVAVLSSLNSTILSGARIYYAMGREKLFFSWVGHLHPKFKSPAKSLWLQFIWSVVLIISGTFNQLLTYTVFVMVCFGFLAGIGLFLIRRKNSRNANIYHTWGFPYSTLIYILLTGWIMINTVLERTMESIIGLGLVFLGIPFFLFFKFNWKTTGR